MEPQEPERLVRIVAGQLVRIVEILKIAATGVIVRRVAIAFRGIVGVVQVR
jgi:hypothetical protein